MIELIERLEKATGQDWALNVAIALEVGWKKSGPFPMWMSPDNNVVRNTPPDFTASIDGALTLVPEGHAAVVCVWPCMAAVEVTNDDHWYDPALHYSPTKAATPALALCIAALKARAGMTPVIHRPDAE